jgi:MinD-like ATPase involved in chromosome partitioning or flagellar assembly
MSVVAFASVRSCGVTTVALALAATWPGGRRVLLAELDPAGGTLAAASGWPPEPGLVSFAAAARRGGDPDLVWGHCQSLPGGAAVLAGPTAAEQARNAVGMLAGLIGRLGELDADVLIDWGRIDTGSPNLGALARGDRVVLVARPRLADLHALATWVETLPLDGDNVGLVLVGDGPYPNNEITEALGIEVLARLPWDPDGAAALVSVPASARQLRMSPMVRGARTLADSLGGETPEATPEERVEEGATAGSLRSRVLRAWRTDPTAPATNGTAPEEVSR